MVIQKFKLFWCAPFGYLYFLSFQLLTEPGLGSGIDPEMALTPFPSSIGRDLNPQPSNHESSVLTTRPDFCSNQNLTLNNSEKMSEKCQKSVTYYLNGPL